MEVNPADFPKKPTTWDNGERLPPEVEREALLPAAGGSVAGGFGCR